MVRKWLEYGGKYAAKGENVFGQKKAQRFSLCADDGSKIFKN